MRFSVALNKFMRERKPEQELGGIQEAWVQTLESGWYHQCKGQLSALRDDGEWGYCCLGIACQLLRDNEIYTERRDYSWDDLSPNYEECMFMRFTDVGGGLWFKKGQLLREVKRKDSFFEDLTGLADMNDSGYSFKQIARFIRAFPELIFSGPA